MDKNAAELERINRVRAAMGKTPISRLTETLAARGVRTDAEMAQRNGRPAPSHWGTFARRMHAQRERDRIS